MTLESAFVFLMSLILLWIKPGPGQLTVLARTLSDGFFAGYAIAAGIMVGNSLYFIFSALGLSALVAQMEIFGLIFKFIGAFYLLYLGYKGLRNIESGQWKKKSSKGTTRDLLSNFTTGLVITFSNPFVIFYYVGLLPHLVPLGELKISDIVIGVFIILYFGMLVDAVICGLAAQIRTALSDGKIVRQVNLLTSIGFIMIGGFLLFSALFATDFSFALG